MKSINCQGAALFYKKRGQGRPLLLLHAGIADSRMWEPQLAAFERRFLTIAPDLRGYGESPIPNGSFAYHEDAAAVIDAQALGSVWLVGASFGSRVAVDLTLAHPDKVRGLVLVTPVISGFEVSAAMVAFDEEEERLLETGDIPGASELNVRTWVDGPFRSPEQVKPQIRTQVAQMSTQAFQAPIPEQAEVIEPGLPATQQLEKIQVPTLIILGELDLPAVNEHGNFLAQGIAGARLETIPDTAHMPSMEKPETFNRLLETFVEETASRL